jgi:hypothetical protein
MSTLPAVEDTQEAGTLARELAAALKRMVEHYKSVYKVSPQEALARALEVSTDYEANILSESADQVSWCDLEYLARQDPDKAARLWERINGEALGELRSGHRAAKVMEGYGTHCWTRAHFLAVRRELMEGWQPRNGIERQLIDTMAQAQTAQLYWLDILTVRSSCSSGRKRDEGRWEPQTVADTEAIDQAAAMVERFNSIYLRTLKALRELRRTPGVVVQNAGQVNVGQQQLNVSAGSGSAPTPAATIP